MSVPLALLALALLPTALPAQYAIPSKAGQAGPSLATGNFATASEAAVGAARRFRMWDGSAGEVGTKIFVDATPSGFRYRYGPLIPGQFDRDTGTPEITVDTATLEGHLALVGLWHRHPSGDQPNSLYDHAGEIVQTHLTIWTSVGTDLYLQYWDGTRVLPQMAGAWSDIAPLCRACV